jgi:L-fuconolactonase
LSPTYQEAFTYLTEIDIPVDLLVHSSQLSVICELIKQVPLRGVIDHIAKPEIKQGKLEPWKSQIAEISSHPNIYCKLSGMVTEAHLKRWNSEEFVPYVHHIIDAFGVERVMYGSDWPVCLLAASYEGVYNLLNDTLPNYVSREDKELIFGKNALRFYKLNN